MIISGVKRIKYEKAFKIIFDKVLSSNGDSQTLIVYDESFLPYFTSFERVCEELCISAAFIFIPLEYQKFMLDNKKFSLENGEVSLPNGISSAISNSNVIINCLNGGITTSKIRGAILHPKKAKGYKLAHCPGLSDEILSLVIKSPYKKILGHSELMAWALGTAETATIITKDSHGKQYHLEMKLEGWRNEPLLSPGVIFENSWGNITPGETFCCPRLLGVHGQICINGSLPNLLLTGSEEIIFTFEKGKLIKFEADHAKVRNYFNDLQQKYQSSDDHWNSFAELGIGLNPAIKKLTGNPLFDEKMAGTIHIAIGDNTEFGHSNKSFIHVDMVALNPTLVLDNHIIIDSGKLNLSLITEWRNGFKFRPIVLNTNSVLEFAVSKINVDGPIAKRRWRKGSRTGYIKLLNKNLTKLLKRLLPDLESPNLRFDYLVKKVGKSKQHSLKELLTILCHYNIVEIK